MAENRSRIGRIFSATFSFLEFIRRLLANLVFVIVLVVLIITLRSDLAPSVPAGSALVLDLSGDLVEQVDQSSSSALDQLLTSPPDQTSVKDLVALLEHAKNDSRIKALYLDLNNFSTSQLTKLQSVARAIHDFRKSGKKVMAYADNYDQDAYYLAAQADEVYMHPMGVLLLQGYGAYPMFYKDLLDKLAINVNVFRVGQFKSAVEPFIRNDMSEPARLANLAWLNQLWSSYKEGVSQGRKLKPQIIQAYIDQFPDLLARSQGNVALAAQDMKLLTGVLNRDQMRDKMIALVGKDESGEEYKKIDFRTYMAAVRPDRETASDQVVGVIVISGTIVDGSTLPGAQADVIAGQIRKAREDASIKAVVLRVDSPGGSAFGAEVIRREVELTRQAGKPVVVSMGSVAASGGYWISLAADQIWASPSTLTGSIGVFGIIPTFENSLNKIGVHIDGVGTTKFAGSLRVDRNLTPEAKRAVQLMVENTYHNFIDKVAKARKLPLNKVDEIAQGRVWSGADAVKLGLVDQLGELPQAIEAAAAKVNLNKNYQIHYLKPDVSLLHQVMHRLRGQGQIWMMNTLLPESLSSMNLQVQNQLKTLLQGDQHGIYAYCDCGQG
jgi:protease-4